MLITKLSISRPVAVVVLSVAVAALGLFALSRLEVNYLPEVTYPMVRITIWWRGATPEDIETNVAKHIEEAMATVDNLDYLDSSSIEGMYTLLVNFRYGVDVDVAYQDVLAIMGRVNRKLPAEIDPPMIMKADPSQLPVLEVTLSSDRHSLVWLRDWAENWLSDRITAIPGTAGTEIVGGLKREIRVNLDPSRLSRYNLQPAVVVAALREDNRQMFAGRVTMESREIIARTLGEFESVEQIRDTVIVRDPGGAMVRIGDVATVEDSHEELRVNTRFNGRPCVKVNVLKQSDANTVLVSRAVRAGLDGLGAEIPEGIEFGFVEDQGEYVMGAIMSVRDSAIIAGILVILVVYLFLGHWRQVAVMLVALPITMLANFFVMSLAGFSLNLFSLGGLVVALGVILDNSIVVLENITRLRHDEAVNRHGLLGNLSLLGTSQVAPAIIASTLTFLGIFLPFLIVPGLASLLFRELVLVVASIVTISLLVSVTITPLLANVLLRSSPSNGVGGLAGFFERLVDRGVAIYASLLSAVVRRRWLPLILFPVLFILGIHWGKQTGSEFLPQVDDGRVMVKLIMPSGTSVEETDRILANVERELSGLPEVQSVFTMAGGKVWGLATYEIAQEGEVNIQLVPKSRRDIGTAEFVKKITPLARKAMAPGARMPVMQMRVKGIRRMGEQQVEVKVRGDDVQAIFEFAQRTAAALEGSPLLGNVNISLDMTKPEYRVYINRPRASALGISVGRVASTLRTLIGGVVSTEYRDGGNYYNIRVRVPEPNLRSKSDIENLVLETRNGRPIRVADLAEVRRATGPVEITRENQVKQIIVRADAAPGVSVGEAAAAAESVVRTLDLPIGVGFAMGGQAEAMAENNQAMGTILFFAFMFAYAVLAIQFNSYLLPLLAIVAIPLSLTGSLGALRLLSIPVGVTVMIGLVVMMGGITSQGVVLLSLAEEVRSRGSSATKAILRAAPLRLRPILMTQLTTIIGLVPLALNLGEGGDMLKPMAVAVIGGLLFSLPLTLFFLPAAYIFTLGWMRKKQAEAII